MSGLLIQPSATALTAAPVPAIITRRIRFVTNAAAGAKVRRVFGHPRPCIAVEEAVGPGELPAPKTWPEPTEPLDVVFVAKGATAMDASWLASPEHPEAAPAVVVEWEGRSIHWRPGRALVQGDPAGQEESLAALIDFAFYEGELRTLEQSLEVGEADAHADVARAYRIRWRDRKHWARIREMIESLARLRLVYARLAPRLAKGSRSLPRGSRRVMGCLLRKADVAARMEAVSSRLEACEDLYEGASDRINDYRGWFTGHMLEIIIILLLLIEVVFFAADLFLRFLDM